MSNPPPSESTTTSISPKPVQTHKSILKTKQSTPRLSEISRASSRFSRDSDKYFQNFTVEDEREQEVVEPKTVQIKPLSVHFEAFAKVRIQDEGEGSYKIELDSIKKWFLEAHLIGQPDSKFDARDLGIVFNRMAMGNLTYKQFERFIRKLAELKSLNPDVLRYRLRTFDTPELDSQFQQFTLPEGAADRLVDLYRDLSAFVDEKFYDASTTEYAEPICTGGIRDRYKEDQIMLEQDMERIHKLKAVEKEYATDPLIDNFVFFSKEGDYYSDGRSIRLTNLIKWMKHGEVFNSESEISVADAVFLFKRLFTLEARICLIDLKHYIKELGRWKDEDPKVLLRCLRYSGPPAQRSITVYHMQVPATVARAMAGTLALMARKYDEDAEAYIPSSVDKPSGHTQMSRDRFFQEKVESRDVHVGDVKNEVVSTALMNTATYQKLLATEENRMKKKKLKKGEEEEDDNQDGPADRAKTNYYTQRWNGAYPYGGHEKAARPIRLDPDIQRYLHSVARKGSSDEMLTSKEKKRLDGFTGLAPVKFVKNFEPVAFPEQFKKFAQFRTGGGDSRAISRNNLELWLTQAHIVDGIMVTLKDVRKVCKQFSDQRFDMDALMTILNSISRKKHLSLTEVMERLCRCGPPQDFDVKRQVQKERPPEADELIRMSFARDRKQSAFQKDGRRNTIKTA